MEPTRHCVIHQGDVSARSAQQVGAAPAATSPGAPVYACLDCIRAHGLVPVHVGQRS